MAPEVDPKIDPLIWTAIEQKRLLRFRYKNRERIVEPHDYGIHKGLVKLFGYQVAGSSSQKLPNWRWAEQDLISDLQLLDRTFPGGRPTKSGKHQKWDKLFIRVKPPDRDLDRCSPDASFRLMSVPRGGSVHMASDIAH
jgi:hypothetical protein